MTVYVDPLFSATPRTAQARSWGNRWCHMTADTTEELHAMADRLGLRRSYVQDAGTWGEHYDLIPSKRALAVRYGAVELTSSEMGRRWVERRETMGPRLKDVARAQR